MNVENPTPKREGEKALLQLADRGQGRGRSPGYGYSRAEGGGEVPLQLADCGRLERGRGERLLPISLLVVNPCSGKPDLPVKIFLPLVLVNKYFTGKKIWRKKGTFSSICV